VYAIINDEVYQEGEEIAGIKVLQIKKREVDILIGGVKQTLDIFPTESAAKPVSTGSGSIPVPDGPTMGEHMEDFLGPEDQWQEFQLEGDGPQPEI